MLSQLNSEDFDEFSRAKNEITVTSVLHRAKIISLLDHLVADLCFTVDLTTGIITVTNLELFSVIVKRPDQPQTKMHLINLRYL